MIVSRLFSQATTRAVSFEPGNPKNSKEAAASAAAAKLEALAERSGQEMMSLDGTRFDHSEQAQTVFTPVGYVPGRAGKSYFGGFCKTDQAGQVTAMEASRPGAGSHQLTVKVDDDGRKVITETWSLPARALSSGQWTTNWEPERFTQECYIYDPQKDQGSFKKTEWSD